MAGNDVILWSTAVPSGNDVWLRDPSATSGGGGTFAALTLVAGLLVQNPAADAASVKVYLTVAGEMVAKTSAGGDKLVNLVAGVLTAA